eukprot:1160675-Pelagomonas_calceolata.AAC.3
MEQLASSGASDTTIVHHVAFSGHRKWFALSQWSDTSVSSSYRRLQAAVRQTSCPVPQATKCPKYSKAELAYFRELEAQKETNDSSISFIAGPKWQADGPID